MQKGAIDQFNGKLEGWLGFFDYVAENMAAYPPVSIVILTDGYAEIPSERAAQGIPVLWIINNEDVTPSWGIVARIDS